MPVTTVDGYDVTHEFIGQAPTTGQAALYSTGSSDIKATPEDIASRPGCLLICQGFTIDTTADYYDVEQNALSPSMLPSIITSAISNYMNNVRPGQRWPAVYCSRDDPVYGVSAVVNALDAAGLGNDSIGLVIADWDNDHAQAQAEVANSVPGPGNPYPVVGRQYENAGSFDRDVFSQPWVNKVSGGTLNPFPGSWKTLVGTYTDKNGTLYVVGVNASTGTLQETARKSFGVWSAPYDIGGKVTLA